MIFRIIILVFFLFCFRLTAFDKSPVVIFVTPDLAAEQAARKIASLIQSNDGKPTVLGLATGSTMIPVYKTLKKIIREESIDLSHVVTFNLDEYLDIPVTHPQSFHSFMFSQLFEELLYSPVNPCGIKKENIHLPTVDNWTEYENMLAKCGPIQLQLLGIGSNGHIGFAEPGTPFNSRTMIVTLLETTRRDNSRFFEGDMEKVPKKAITMGIGTILEAKEIILLAFGENKADAISKTINGPISVDVPSTALQMHPETTFFIDEKAALMLMKPEPFW